MAEGGSDSFFSDGDPADVDGDASDPDPENDDNESDANLPSSPREEEDGRDDDLGRQASDNDVDAAQDGFLDRFLGPAAQAPPAEDGAALDGGLFDNLVDKIAAPTQDGDGPQRGPLGTFAHPNEEGAEVGTAFHGAAHGLADQVGAGAEIPQDDRGGIGDEPVDAADANEGGKGLRKGFLTGLLEGMMDGDAAAEAQPEAEPEPEPEAEQEQEPEPEAEPEPEPEPEAEQEQEPEPEAEQEQEPEPEPEAQPEPELVPEPEAEQEIGRAHV
jgi:hypothetical protein